jgi:hypothetical protein
MNTSRDHLSDTLRHWQVTPPVSANFRQKVWERIGKQAGTSWTTYLRAHLAAWSVTAALVVGAAAFTGSTLARSRAHADREAIVVAYLVDLDPRVQAVLKP